MLKINNLNAWYGASHILQNINFCVNPGETVAILGRNGAGKTTTLKSIMGLVHKATGEVLFKDQNLLKLPVHKRFSLGLAYVPEDRRIVPGLTVLENIRLGLLASPRHKQQAEIIERIAETFPRLKERLNQDATTMSGGEQQMLAIARALASDPDMILLDEPSEGIMPILVQEMFELFDALHKQGKTIVLVEQNVELALKYSQRVYILDQGTIVHSDSSENLLANPEIQEKYCSV